jgi:hypothetical protein
VSVRAIGTTSEFFTLRCAFSADEFAADSRARMPRPWRRSGAGDSSFREVRLPVESVETGTG